MVWHGDCALAVEVVISLAASFDRAPEGCNHPGHTFVLRLLHVPAELRGVGDQILAIPGDRVIQSPPRILRPSTPDHVLVQVELASGECPLHHLTCSRLDIGEMCPGIVNGPLRPRDESPSLVPGRRWLTRRV